MVVLTPKGALRVMDTMIRIRGEVALAREKREFLTELVSNSVKGDKDVRVTNFGKDGDIWAMTVLCDGTRSMRTNSENIAAL